MRPSNCMLQAPASSPTCPQSRHPHTSPPPASISIISLPSPVHVRTCPSPCPRLPPYPPVPRIPPCRASPLPFHPPPCRPAKGPREPQPEQPCRPSRSVAPPPGPLPPPWRPQRQHHWDTAAGEDMGAVPHSGGEGGKDGGGAGRRGRGTPVCFRTPRKNGALSTATDGGADEGGWGCLQQPATETRVTGRGRSLRPRPVATAVTAVVDGGVGGCRRGGTPAGKDRDRGRRRLGTTAAEDDGKGDNSGERSEGRRQGGASRRNTQLRMKESARSCTDTTTE